ncbi:MAG: serine/threonine-protein kinase, partial [Planctomycetota bacterium]
RVFVTDFGLARVIDDASMTQSGLLAGTPQYMSPEQVKGATAATTSDLFSLGSVMYAMCTGHPPFRADSVYGVMHRIAHDTPRRLNEANPRAPSWLDALVGRLLAKDADQRFATADEVAEILWAELAYLQNPSSTPKPARDWLPARRRKRMVSAAIVGLVAIVASAGIAASAWRGGNENGPVAAGSSQVAGEDWPGQPVGATQRSAPQANGVSSDPIDPNQETLDSEPENVWNNADLVGANQQADRLEAEWRSSTSQSTDLWQVELSRASALAAALEEQEQSEPTP